MRCAVTDNDLGVQALRLGIRMADVVIVPGRIHVRRVTVHSGPFVVWWGEVAGFNDRCHVNRGRRVSSYDDAVFFNVLRCLKGGIPVIRQRGQPEVTGMN